MILRRIGNKSKIASRIQQEFPPHRIYIEPFFGAGGMYFNKSKAKFNTLNDLDGDVFNLFMCVIDRKQDLYDAFKIMPVHTDLLNYWKINKETDPIKKALRFLFLSNFTYLGKMDSLNTKLRDLPKEQFYNKIDKTFEMLKNVSFRNWDFRKLLSSLSFVDIDFGNPSFERESVFIYSDSPYLDTVDTYSDSETWKEQDCIDLFDCLQETKCKFGLSEFNHPFVINQAIERGLNIINIGERKNLKNVRTEILITNYKNNQQKLF